MTNLPNKFFLRDSFDYLKSLLSSNQKFSIQNENLSDIEVDLIAVLNISLDRFFKVNNCLSQQQKNIFVKEIAQRLNQYVGKCDFPGIIIYLKEDSFLVMIPVDKQIRASKYGQDILHIIRQAFYIDNHEIFISASIGIAFYPNDNQNLEELLEQGEKATRYAQKQGGNRCQLFTFAFNIKNPQAAENLAMEAELHRALDKQEFELYYQPKIDLRTNLVIGAEALLRWNHYALGKITAERFISLAEESGLIKPIGEWVLQQA